ncbi:MAG: serine hydrolase, partial [Ktedonobacterales bacterium]
NTTNATNTAGLSDEVLGDGLVDGASGIVRLPLVHTLLAAGSELPIGGSDSLVTYVTLRDATRAEAMVPAPANAAVVSTPTATGAQATASVPSTVFVPGGTRDTAVVGHVIPGTIWRYITAPSNAPDGWQVDFGSPLTEALPFTATIAGVPHTLLVQVFWREALLVDMTAVDAAGEPTITPLNTGLDYLRTLGPPAVVVAASEQAWGLSDMAVLNAPGIGGVLVHVGMNYPLTLTGQAQWWNGALWYSVHWRAPTISGTGGTGGTSGTGGAGWAPAHAITFTSPGNAPAYAEFDVLSPALAAYLSSLRGNAGAAVYDVTRNVYYTYNVGRQFTVASSVKVPIMLTFLAMTESQAREPNGDELYL